MDNTIKVNEKGNSIFIITGLLRPGECGPIIDMSKYNFIPTKARILASSRNATVRIEASQDNKVFTNNIHETVFFRVFNAGPGTVEKTLWKLSC